MSIEDTILAAAAYNRATPRPALGGHATATLERLDDDLGGGYVVRIAGGGSTLLVNPRRFLELHVGRALTDAEWADAWGAWLEDEMR